MFNIHILKKNKSKSMEPKECDNWLSPEIWKALDANTAEFSFSQGEKYLDELCKESAAVTNRCYTLLGIILAVCPFLISTAISINDSLFSGIAYVFVSVCVGLCIMLIGIIKPRGGLSVGRSPKDLLRIEDLEHYQATSCKSYLKYELENLQYKIERTEKTNEERAAGYKLILYILLVSSSGLLAFAMFFTSFCR